MRTRCLCALAACFALAACASATTPGYPADGAALPDGAAPPADAPPGDGSVPTVVVSNLAVIGECMPAVPADPIDAGWTVTVRGASGTVATLRSATLTLQGPHGTLRQGLAVDMPRVVLEFGSATQMQRKTGADNTTADACGSFCSSGTARLTLVFDVGGTTVTAEASSNVGCVF